MEQNTIENTIESCIINELGHFGWGQSAVGGEEIRDETGNVGVAIDVPFGLAIIPSGSDVHAGSEDIDGGTEIGCLGPCILEIRIGDSDRFLNAGGGWPRPGHCFRWLR